MIGTAINRRGPSREPSIRLFGELKGLGKPAINKNPRPTGRYLLADTRPNPGSDALGLENTLRLENDGGGGTKCKHWDEDSFAIDGSSELMTGGFEAGLYQPISRMTVAALDDLGVYGPLNYAAADPYPATRRKLEEGPGFEVLTPTESFTLDGDDEYVVEVEPVPLDA